jgi:chemotaxis protein methyltransferase CheR
MTGQYPSSGLGEVPAAMRESSFEPSAGGVGVAPAVQALVTFKQLNLLGSWPMKGPFDAIFCRNVMIYFDQAGQESVVNRLAPLLEPNGYLFIGHAEGLAGVEHPLRYIQPAVYKRCGGRAK